MSRKGKVGGLWSLSRSATAGCAGTLAGRGGSPRLPAPPQPAKSYGGGETRCGRRGYGAWALASSKMGRSSVSQAVMASGYVGFSI